MIDLGVPAYSDQHRETFSGIEIQFDGVDLTRYVVWKETWYESVAAAQPGTCQITLRGPNDETRAQWIVDMEDMFLDREGGQIKFFIDGDLTWRGYGQMITRTFWFADKTEPKYIIHGVDLNILFDRLIIYNHNNPTRWPTGGGYYVRSNTGLKAGGVPQGEMDREFLKRSLRDTDYELVTPKLKTNLIQEVGSACPDGPGNTLSAGSTMRALFEETSSLAISTQPGSVVWFIDPDGYLVYRDIDSWSAPFSVSDDGTTDVACRDLEFTKDASHIKNDVLIFAGSLDPRPNSDQEYLKYSHRLNENSIERYGRFQFSETLPAWSQLSVNARSRKIIYQEGTPGMRATFTIFRKGLFPGMIMSLSMGSFGLLQNLPVRSVRVSFDNPNFARYTITASYDTNDPWGILLALKRPASRGLVQPRMQSLELSPGQEAPPADIYTHVEERPAALGGNVYQCSYSYIRYSLVVYVSGRHGDRYLTEPGESSTDAFIETSPKNGQFRVYPKTAGQVWVAYHVAGNL